MTLTPDAVRALQALAEKATPGPWPVEVWYGSVEGGWAAVGPHHRDGELDEPGCEDNDKADRDADFIAAARNALPALCADWLEMHALLEEPLFATPASLPEWVVKRDALLARMRKEPAG